MPPRSPARIPPRTRRPQIDGERNLTTKTPRRAFSVEATKKRRPRNATARSAERHEAAEEPLEDAAEEERSADEDLRRADEAEDLDLVAVEEDRQPDDVRDRERGAEGEEESRRRAPDAATRRTTPRSRRIQSTSNWTSSTAGLAARFARKGRSAADEIAPGRRSSSTDAGKGLPERVPAAPARLPNERAKRPRASSGETRRTVATSLDSSAVRSRAAIAASSAPGRRKTVTAVSSRSVSTTPPRFSAARRKRPTRKREKEIWRIETTVIRRARQRPESRLVEERGERGTLPHRRLLVAGREADAAVAPPGRLRRERGLDEPLEDAAPVEREAAPARLLDEGHVVGRDEDGRPADVDLREEPHHLLGEAVVEVPGRLVGDEELGLVDERARERHALLLAPRELLRERVHPVVELDEAEDLVGAAPPFGERDAEELQDERDVLEDGPRREELVVLEDDPHRPPQLGDAPGRHRADVPSR